MTDLFNHPIPESVQTGNYFTVPFDKTHAAAQEPLIDLLAAGLAGESFYGRTDGLNAPYYTKFPDAYNTVYLREGVASKLRNINKNLEPMGLELYLLDGHRPISVQQNLWDFFYSEVSRKFPKASEEEKINYVRTFVSDPRRFNPDDDTTWPIHSTGGAIDLTLKRIGKPELLYMGGIFDDGAEISFARFYEVIPAQERTGSDTEAMRNRRLLYHVMRAEGFTHNVSEWWHFDYGTQRWAHVKQLETKTPHLALYPTITL